MSIGLSGRFSMNLLEQKKLNYIELGDPITDVNYEILIVDQGKSCKII